MKVYNRVVIDIASGRVEEEDSYEYDGPVALCITGGDGEGSFGLGDYGGIAGDLGLGSSPGPGDPMGPGGEYGGPGPGQWGYQPPMYGPAPALPPVVAPPTVAPPATPTFNYTAYPDMLSTVMQSPPYSNAYQYLTNAQSQMQPYWNQAAGALNNYSAQQQQYLGNIMRNQQQYSNLALPQLTNMSNTLQGYINQGVPYQQEMINMINNSQASAAGLQSWLTGLQGSLGAGGASGGAFYGGPLKDYLDKLQAQGLVYAPQQEEMLKQMASQEFFRGSILPEMQTALRSLNRSGLPSASYADAALANTLGSLFNKNQWNTLQGYQNLGQQMQAFQNNLAGGYGKYGDIGNAYNANNVAAASVNAKMYGDQLTAIVGGYGSLRGLYDTGVTGGNYVQGNANNYQQNMLTGLTDVNQGYRDYGNNMQNFGYGLANAGNVYGNNLVYGWNNLGQNVGNWGIGQGGNWNGYLSNVNAGVNTGYRPEEYIGNKLMDY